MLFNLEVESYMIGAAFLRPAVLDEVQLPADAFYWQPHSDIWRVMQELINDGMDTLDAVVVGTRWEKKGLAMKLDTAKDDTIITYLGDLQRNAVSAANAHHWAAQLKEMWAKRRIQKVLHNGMQLLSSSLSADDILAQFDTVLRGFDDDQHTELAAAETYVDVSLRNLDRRSQGENAGIMTGLIDLDKKTNGLQPQDLILLAARPSMGKTALALNIAEYVAAHQALPVAVFSLEMPGFGLTDRLIVARAKVDGSRFRAGTLEDDEWRAVDEAAQAIRKLPLYIDETGAIALPLLAARARQLSRKVGGLALIVVDYVQLMTGEGENRQQEVSNLSRGLKALAKELNCPVIALSQLNRSLESRPNKRPVLSDLRESGGLEQDGDVVMALYRDAVYNEDTPDQRLAELIILKQRNGPIGTVNLTFFGEHTRFANYAPMESSFQDRYAGAAERKGKY